MTDFFVGLIAIERKTGTAQIVLGASHLTIEGTIIIERCGTTVTAFVPEFVTDTVVERTHLIRGDFLLGTAVRGSITEILSKSICGQGTSGD